MKMFAVNLDRMSICVYVCVGSLVICLPVRSLCTSTTSCEPCRARARAAVPSRVVYCTSMSGWR